MRRLGTFVLSQCACAILVLLVAVQAFGQRGVDTSPLALAPEPPADYRCACITVRDALDLGPVTPGGEVWIIDEDGASPATVLPGGSFYLDGLGEKVTLEFSHPNYGKGQLQLYLGDSKFCHVTVALGSDGATLLSCARSTTDRAVYELKGNAPAVRAQGSTPRPAPGTKLATKGSSSSQPLSKTLALLDLPCLPGNGDESNAPIHVDEGNFAGDLADNTGSADLDSAGFNNTIDEWLCFVSSCTGEVTVTTCRPGTQFDTVLSVWSNGAEISANDDALGSPEACTLGGLNRFSTVNFRAVQGEAYLIRVSAFNDAFDAQGGWGTGYEVAIGCTEFQLGDSNCCSPHPFPGCDDEACQAAVCAADAFCCNTEWDGLCATAANAACAVCAAGGGECSGDGEDCESALTAMNGNNAGSTIGNGGSATSGCAVNDTIDEWWCYTADCDGTATASTCNQASFDTVIAVYAACGGSQLACTDDTAGCSGFSTTVSWSVTAGTEYKIRIAGYNNSSGDYTLTLSCEGDGGGDSNCCVPNGGVGCDDPECEALICGADAFCCDVEWDQLCANAAIAGCEACAGGGGGDSNCCVANGGLGCDDPTCEATVCAADPFCCDTAWDSICAGEAETLCPDLCAGTGVCPGSGSCFEPQETPGCSDEECCNTVCAVDPFCCDVAWDGVCVGQAQSLCEQQEPVGACCFAKGGITEFCFDGYTADQCTGQGGDFQGPGSICSQVNCDGVPNDLCEDAIETGPGQVVEGTTIGATIDNDAPDCPGAPGISAPGVWYSVTGTGNTLIANTCGGASYDTQITVYCGECRDGGGGGEPSNCCVANGGLGCDDPECQSTVCGVDAFCCDVAWDSICAGQAQTLCPICQFGLSTGQLTCVGANDDFCGLQSQVTWCSEPGVEYLILVHGFGGQTGTFSLAVVAGTGQCTPTIVCAEVATGACCVCGDSAVAEAFSCILTTEEGCDALQGTFLGAGTTCGSGQTVYTDPVGAPIPDGNAAGVSDVFNVPASFTITDVNIDLSITHTWVGDLCVEVSHNATTVLLIQRPGSNVVSDSCHSEGPFGCNQDNYVNIILDDEAGSAIESQCALNLTGSFTPFQPLSAFDGQNASGAWTITVSDNAAFDSGVFGSWSLHFESSGENPCSDQCAGACCFDDGSCIEATESDCTAQGGSFLGAGTTCSSSPCVGACCLTGGTPLVPPSACQVLSLEACNAQGGVYQGFDTMCSTAQCDGACCFENGDCQELLFNNCMNAGGEFQGIDTRCEPNPCAVPGACCLCFEGQQCVELLETECLGVEGTFLGENTECDAELIDDDDDDHGNGFFNPCLSVCCVLIEFEQKEDGTPLPNGAELDDSLWPSLFTIQSSGYNAGPAVFDSTPGGPNQNSDDPDLLVNTGNVGILQNNLHANQSVPGIFDSPDDDSTQGGVWRFDFVHLVQVRQVDLIDIDHGGACTVRLYDDAGKTRTYNVQDFFTTNNQGGLRTLDLTALGVQQGVDGDAFGSEQSGFDEHRVVRLDFLFGGSAAIDNLLICQKEDDDDHGDDHDDDDDDDDME